MNQAEFDTAIAGDVGRMFSDPLSFVRYAFPWGKGDLAEWEGPDEWQTEFLQDLGKGVNTLDAAVRMATAAGHGVGKSVLVAWVILWAMSTRPHLAGVVTANTGTQLETKTWRELSLWHKRAVNAHWFTWTATKFYQNDHPETWFVAAVPWSKEKPEAFAGLHAEHVLMIFDEGSSIDDLIYDTAEGAQTTKGAIWCVFGNPTRNTGRFKECFGRFRHRWVTRQVDSRTAKAANQAQIQQWLDDYGEDSDFFRIRVRGVFPRAGSTQFIPSDIVEEAQKREAESDRGAPLVMGVDIARFGDDQSVICFRQGRDAKTMPAIKWRNRDLHYSANRIAEHIKLYAPKAIFIDGGGVGAGVIDMLKAWNFQVIEVNFGAAASEERKYANKRAEMWAAVKTWLPTGSLETDIELVADLTGPEYGFDKDNRIQLEKKADMKKRGLASPDYGDALALTFAGPVARLDLAASLYAARNAVAETDYPMFS